MRHPSYHRPTTAHFQAFVACTCTLLVGQLPWTLLTGSWHPKASLETTGRPFRFPVTRHANEPENDGRRWQPGGPDVRSLLQTAGLLPPKPTERWVREDEDRELETPLDQLKNYVEDTFIKPNVETLVPEDEDREFETPVSSLIKSVEKLDSPLSFLFQEDEELESEEMWSDLIAPLLNTDSVVDTMNESNYLTVTLRKPLGLTVEENPRDLGGGVSVVALEDGSKAERVGLQPGIQLLAAGGVPVHGMSLEDAIQPIVAAEDKVQLTFFNGSAEAFYGLLGPKPSWLSAFLHKLHIKHLAWQWQEGQTPKGRTWSWALELLDGLRDSGADVTTYSSAVGAAIEACQKASRWQPALTLLDDLRKMPVPADLSAYRAALVACDRGGEPLQAMWLLDEMKAAGIEPDASSYDSAINSCRAFLRALQTQSSSLPSMPYPKRKRKQRKPPRRNKKKLV